jgi:carbon storage regulator
MLVLSRKHSEQVEILGGLFRVAVVEIRGDKVRLGVEAPEWAVVHRDEVLAAIARDEDGPTLGSQIQKAIDGLTQLLEQLGDQADSLRRIHDADLRPQPTGFSAVDAQAIDDSPALSVVGSSEPQPGLSGRVARRSVRSGV